MHQLWPGMVVGKAGPQSIDQGLPACQQPLEGDGPGDLPVVEEQRDRTPGRQTLQVSPPRVDAPAGDILPSFVRGQRTEVRSQRRTGLAKIPDF